MKRVSLFFISLLLVGNLFAQTEAQANAISTKIDGYIPTNLPNIFGGTKICVDPGHGGHNPGNDRYIYWLDKYLNVDDYGLAYWESNGNFYTALYMQAVLEKLGAVVKLTRDKNDHDIVLAGTSYGNGGAIGTSDPKLSYREDISNAFGAKYFQSVHTNATGAAGGDATPNITNYVRAYIPNSNSSIQTAVSIKMANRHSQMNYSYDTQAQVNEFSVTNNVVAYAVLTEAGFHTQVAEGRRLRSTLYLQTQAMAWIKAYIDQEGKTSQITWGEIGGITYSDEASEYAVGPTAKGYELGLGLNQVKVTLDKGTANEKFVMVDQDELDANYNEGEYVSGGNHITQNGGYNGYYYFNFVSPGSHSLTFEKPGVTTKTQTVTVTAGGHLRNDVKLTVAGTPATAPTLKLVKPNGSDGVEAKWTAHYSGSDLVGYRLYYATDDTKNVWKLAADENTIGASVETITIATKSSFVEIPTTTPKHYKIAAVTNVDGTIIVGDESDVLSKYNGSISKNILIVEGFDRRGASYSGTSNFITTYINAIAGAKDVNICSTLNDFIITGDVTLSNYDAVVWVLGDESTADNTFNVTEQTKVKTYLDAGGNLLVSGSEIGWDLDYKGNGISFYNNYLKADYVADGIARTQADGVATTILEGVSIATNVTYTAGYADEISAINGSSKVMTYTDGSGAGVYYKGTFGSGTVTGSVLNLSFPLETASIADMSIVIGKYFDDLDGFSTSTGCNMTATSTADYFVRYVKMVDVASGDVLLVNETAPNTDNGYGDYTALEGMTVIPGQDYKMMLRGKYLIDNSVNPTWWKVWIDIDGDGKFNGIGEEVISKQNDAWGYNTFTMPALGMGTYTLRVATSGAEITDACTDIAQGEIEDYTITVPCNMSATSTADYFVRYVKMVDVASGDVLLVNETAPNADNGYGDYTALEGMTVFSGQDYKMMLRGKYLIDNSVNPTWWKVWIDIDGDGSFNGVGEEVISKQNDAWGYNTFTMPALAEGSYILRVATSGAEITDACTDIAQGEIEDYTIRIFTPNLHKWVGKAGNGVWGDSDNWEPSIPQSSADSIIIELAPLGSGIGGIDPQPPIINSGTTINQEGLRIANGNEFRIDGGSIVIGLKGVENKGTLIVGVSGNLDASSITNESSFVIESDATGTGSVITSGSVNNGISNTGTFEVQRWVDSNNTSKWYLISSPVSEENFGAFYGHFLNSYDEVTGSFSDETDETKLLIVGDGYVARLDGQIAGSVSSIVYNEGVLNTGDKTIALATGDGNTYFDLPTNFNLIGNPYPSYLNWDKIFYSNFDGNNENKVSPFLYYYLDNGNGVSDTNGSSSNGWVVYDATNHNPSNAGYAPLPEAIISNGQGFGVVINSNVNPLPNSILIPNSARTHDKGKGFGKKNSNSSVDYSFDLIAKSHGVIDKSKFNFNDNASNSYDVMYDAYKFNSFGDAPVVSFVTDDNKKLSICRTSESTEFVNLGFKMDESEEVTFSTENVNNFTELILEDKVENKFTDLTKGNYTFAHSTNDKEFGRFVLHFNKQALSDGDEILENINCYVSNNTLFLNSSSTLTDVDVNIYNTSGAIVHQAEFSTMENEEIQLGLPNGIYIVELRSNEGVTTLKVSL